MGKANRQLNEEGLVIRVNKEAEKRERDEIKIFVKELLKLPETKYTELPIDSVLHHALREGKKLTNNALKRHLSFLVRLVHEQNFPAIKTAHDRVHHPHRNDPTKIREINFYRERLIANDKDILSELLNKFADIDIQYVRQLSRNAAKETQIETQRMTDSATQKGTTFDGEIKPTKSSKLLYQYLFKLDLL